MSYSAAADAVQSQLLEISDLDAQLREMELKVQKAKAELQETDEQLTKRRKEWELRAGAQMPLRWKRILRNCNPSSAAKPSANGKNVIAAAPSAHAPSWKALSSTERELICEKLQDKYQVAEQAAKRHEFEVLDLKQKISTVEKQIDVEDETERQLEAAKAKLVVERKYFEEEVRSQEIAQRLQRQLQEEADQIARDEQIAMSLNNFTCELCATDLPIDDAFALDCCNKLICRDCMKMHLEVKVGEGISQIPCPMNCRGIVPQPQGFMVATEEMQRKILNLGWTQVQQSPDFTFCRAADCRGIRCLEDLGGGQSTCPDHFVCPLDSKHQWCLKCDCIWHDKVTCEKYQAWKKDNANADAETDKLIAQMGWKRCPNCRNAVEKAAGCNAMRCRCGCAFCYRCNFNAGVGGDAHHGCG